MQNHKRKPKTFWMPTNSQDDPNNFHDPVVFEKQDEQTKAPLVIQSRKRSISASILADFSVCPLKGEQRLRKTKVLAPSQFTREILVSGEQYETELVLKNSQIWRSLLRKNYPEIKSDPGLIDLTEEKNKRNQITSQNHIKRITKDIENSGPLLFYQIQLWEENEEKYENDLAQNGIVDLALWTGEHWILGEIKTSSKPEKGAALQLHFYREIWEKVMPHGDKISPEIFIIHCKQGFVYEAFSTHTKQKESIEASQLTKFKLKHSDRIYLKIKESKEKALEKIRKGISPDYQTEAQFQTNCIECAYRSNCYESFSQEPAQGGYHLDKSGLPDSDVQLLKENYGFTTIKETLGKLETLHELHDNNTYRIKALETQLKWADQKGGYSSWIAPTKKSGVTKNDYQQNEIYFFTKYTKSMAWAIGTQGLPSYDNQIPDYQKTPPQFIIVVYTAQEANWAKQNIPKTIGSQSYQIITLEQDIQKYTHWPYPNYTLKAVSDTLQQLILSGKSWNEIAKTNILPYFKKEEYPKKKDKEKLTDREAQTENQKRIRQLQLLWECIIMMQYLIKPL